MPEPDVRSLGWLGVRTDRFAAMAAFYADALGLECLSQTSDDARFRLADGTEIHVYGPGDEDHAFFGAGPVVAFRVADFAATRARMVAAGIEFIGPVQRDGAVAWNHFRAPDGNVYEIVGPIR
jgi:catechol 2,3-dioxygenase-like lactoylglutathione lyase family enzyme